MWVPFGWCPIQTCCGDEKISFGHMMVFPVLSPKLAKTLAPPTWSAIASANLSYQKTKNGKKDTCWKEAVLQMEELDKVMQT